MWHDPLGAMRRLFTPGNMLVWLIGLGFGCVIGLVPYMLQAAQPSIVLEHLQENDGVVIRGGSLDLVATVRHTKDCPRKIERWLWRCRPGSPTCDAKAAQPDDTQWVPIEAPNGPPIPMGDRIHYTLSVPLPANVEPGEWFFTGRGRDECSWLPSFLAPSIRTTGNVAVRVENPSQDHPATVITPPAPLLVLPAGK